MKTLILAAAVALTACSALKKKDEGPRQVPPHLAGWSYECHKLSSVEEGQFCLHVKGVPKDTLWYFHGAGCSHYEYDVPWIVRTLWGS